MEINKWERVTVASGGQVTKSNVLAPPDLLAPVHLEPLIEPDPKHAPVHFGWAAVPDAVSYELRVSTNAMFTRMVADKTVAGTTAELSGLDSGDYFWNDDSHGRAQARPRSERRLPDYRRGAGQRTRNAP